MTNLIAKEFEPSSREAAFFNDAKLGHSGENVKGAETKILAKAMTKQIDRVIGDLARQVEEFRRAGGNPIGVGFVGVNYAENYTSYEGERPWPTDGRKYKHRVQEAAAAETRLRDKALPSFDEFLFLRFRAANVEPYPFE